MDKPTVKEILKEFAFLVLADNSMEVGVIKDLSINQAEAQINEIYKKKYLEMLPKEKKCKYNFHYKDSYVNCDCAEFAWYNSAIQEMKRRIV